MDYMGALRVWKGLMDAISNIREPDRKMYHDALLAKAIDEWGFNPEDVSKRKVEKPFDESMLVGWEKEIYNIIKAWNEYGIDISGGLDRSEMMDFIRDGGGLADIPSDIRTDYIVDLYLDCLKKM